MSTDKIYYNKPAANWNEAMPLGNGEIGAMVYGNPEMETIHLNLDTLWSGEPHTDKCENKQDIINKLREHIFSGEYIKSHKLANEENFFEESEVYLPLGDIHINTITQNSEVQKYKRFLDMRNAVHECSYTLNYNTEYYTKMFISNPDDVMVIKTGNNSGEILSFTLYYDCFLKNDLKIDKDTIYISGILPYKIDRQNGEVFFYDESKDTLRFHIQIKVVQKGGNLICDSNRLTVLNCEEAMILISAKTNFVNYKTVPDKNINLKECCSGIIDKALKKGYDNLYDEHIRYFNEKYDRISFSLTDYNDYEDACELIENFKKDSDSLQPIEILFNFGRYMMISGSAPHTQAMNLQGIWNKDPLPKWRCNYTTNINTEMNYWMCEACNLPEFHEPLIDMIEELTEAGEKTAREVYGCGGSVAHHNVDLWRKTTPAPGNACWALWPMGLAWLTRHLWEHYIYSQDVCFLKNRAYPLIEKSVEFFFDFLIEKDGCFITCPSTSPENEFVYEGEKCAVVYNSAMDIGILNDLFGNYLAIANILGIENDNIKKAYEIFRKLPSYKIASDGRLIEWDVDHEESQPGHRHFSHLYGIYPGKSIKIAGEEFVEAAKKSLEFRLKNGSGHTGWSCAWVINLYARFGCGDDAYRYIKKLICDSMYMNFMDAHPPFQIDGNLGFVSGICEMLVQSEFDGDGIVDINILPAIPELWKKGEIKGIKAKGNITLDIKWENTKVFVRVKNHLMKYRLLCDKFELVIIE